MGIQNRRELIQEISRLRGSEVLCYITGDRENVSTRIAPDAVRVFYRHLELLGKRKRLDLFLYTRGGDVLTPWRLVHLLREYSDRIAVLVPFRAYSAGTLLCLGANEIVMGKLGELGPIDPNVANAFNPSDPANPIARLPVSVEDVSAYLDLARAKAGLHSPDHLAEAFQLLSQEVHPLALGNVHRNYLLIRSLAKKLLLLHMSPAEEEDRVAQIVDHLTEKLYAHNHMISRREAAREIHLPVVYPSSRLEVLMWNLYEDYEADLSLREPFSPLEFLNGHGRTSFEVPGGYVESRTGSDRFVFVGTAERTGDLPEQVSVNILQQGWRPVV